MIGCLSLARLLKKSIYPDPLNLIELHNSYSVKDKDKEHLNFRC